MPKIFGTNLLGIVLAAIVFFMLGWVWYGMLFMEQWMAVHGLATDGEMAMGPMIGGFIIGLLQVVGLSFILHHAGASTLKTCAKICAIVAVLIAIPMAAYNVNYVGKDVSLLWIDGLYSLVGFVLIGIVLSFFRGKDAIGED